MMMMIMIGLVRDLVRGVVRHPMLPEGGKPYCFVPVELKMSRR